MINNQVNESWGIGNIVAQHHAKIQFVNEDRYLWVKEIACGMRFLEI
jgi:hypothetical protein